jgi:hypothetical protein
VQLIILLMAAQSVASPPLAEQGEHSSVRPPLVLDLNDCPPSDSGEIVVCGRPRGPERYRIPERFRNDRQPGDRIGGIGPVSLDPNPFAPCGIFQGERRCNKRDMADYGYGNGRNPIAVGARIIGELTDPD